MNLVIFVWIVFLLSLSCSLELDNKTKETQFSDSLQTRRSQLTPPSNQHTINKDGLKLGLTFNNLPPKVLQQKSDIIQPITNLRVRPRPTGLRQNRISTLNRGLPNVYYPVKTFTARTTAAPKSIFLKKPVLRTTNVTKSTPDSKDEKFYIEIDKQMKDITSPVTKTSRTPLDSQIQETVTKKRDHAHSIDEKENDIRAPIDTPIKESVLTNTNEECTDDTIEKKNVTLDTKIKEKVLTKLNAKDIEFKKDNNEVIKDIIKDLPDLIKDILASRTQADKSPIVIKNITEINFPIQKGSEVKTEYHENDNINQNKFELTNPNVKNEKVLNRKQYNKDLLNLLLKTIKQNETEVPDTSSKLSLNNSENDPGESIEINLNNYSEIVERKLEPIVIENEVNDKLVNTEPLVPYTETQCVKPNAITNFNQNVYDSDPKYTVPNFQATPVYNPNVNIFHHLYSKPDTYTYNNFYAQNSLPFMKYPYRPIPQIFYNNNDLLNPTCQATDDAQNTDDDLDDNKNTTWKTWSKAEIIIKTKNNTDWFKPMFMQSRGYPTFNNGYYNNNYYYPKYYIPPVNRNYPGHVFPNLYIKC